MVSTAFKALYAGQCHPPCTPPFRVHDDGDDGTRKTARGPPTDSPTVSASCFVAEQDRLCGLLLRRTPYLLPGPPVGFSDETILSKRAPPCRPFALTRRMPSSQDPPFTMVPGYLTPPQPSMAVLGRAGVYNQVEFDTPECVHHRIDGWVTCGIPSARSPSPPRFFLP